MYLPSQEIKIVERIDHFAKPVDMAVMDALYAGEEAELLLESASLVDIDAKYRAEMDAIPSMLLEAIKAKAVRLESRIIAFSRALKPMLAPVGIEVSGHEIGKPKKSGAVAVQIAKINLSDGQSVSLVFHAPDNDPMKINADDTLIAFRFLLNSRDVTHVVAPSGGRDISLKQTALALSNLAERNAPKFAAAQELKASQAKELEEAQAQIETLEAEIAQISTQADEAEDQLAKRQKQVETLNKQIATQNEIQADLQAQIDAKKSTAASAPEGESGLTILAQKLDGSAKFIAARKAVKADGNGSITSSLLTIAAIDVGAERGLDRALFVSSIAGKVKRLAKNGYQDQVDNVLTMINEYNKVAVKPAITLRNTIWKLGEPKDLAVEEVPEVPEFDLKSMVIGEGWDVVERLQANGYVFIGTDKIPSIVNPKGRQLDFSLYKDFSDYVNYQAEMMDAAAQVDAVHEANKENPKDQINTHGYLIEDYRPTNGNSFAKVKAADLDASEYVVQFGQYQSATIAKTESGFTIQFVIGNGLLVETISYAKFGDVKSKANKDFLRLGQIVTDQFTVNGYTQEQLDNAVNGSLLPVRDGSAGQTQAGVEDEQEGLFWYGLQARPHTIGATPRSKDIVKYLSPENAPTQFPDAGNKIRHGAIAYAEALTAKDVSDFELQPLFDVEDEAQADEDVANYIAIDFLEDHMKEQGLKVLTPNQLNDLILVLNAAGGDMQKAFGPKLRTQDAFKNRKADPEGYKTWLTSLKLVNAEMLKEAAESNSFIVSEQRQKNEAAIVALQELIKGKRLPDGWILNREIDGANGNLDQRLLIAVDIRSPLYELGEYAGGYMVLANEDGSFRVTYDEGSPVLGADSLNDWGQIKDALHGVYVADLKEQDNVSYFTGSDYEEEFNALRVAEGLAAINGLDDADEELTQHEDNASDFAGSIDALITSVKAGVLALKDAKLMLKDTLYHSIPERVRGDVLSMSNNARNKNRWAEDVGYWLKNARDYDANAPVVVVGGETFDFNLRTYDMMDEIGMFARTWAAVGKAHPEKIVSYFAEMPTFEDSTAEQLAEAAKGAYLKQTEPELPATEPEEDPEPELTPAQEEPTPEAVESDQEEQYLSKLREIRDFDGEVTVELVNDYQTAIEEAYAYFESNDGLDENSDLIEAAFNHLIEIQTKA